MDLDRALAFSRYAARLIEADPRARQSLVDKLEHPFDWASELGGLEAAAAGDDADALDRALRQLRQRLVLHTLARDLTGRADLDEVCTGVTTLADRTIAAATSFHHRLLAARHGEPIGEETGEPQSLVVIGMGKLGGEELNVSSDVDLVFAYPEDGETGGTKPIANREFFDRLGRRVIASLHEPTADGFVFRVDMRLRPYGESGPLTVPFAALETYLITQGRAWERYAWLKARALTGTGHGELDAIVAPFVFRKYLDFDVYEGLRDIHRQIREQATRRDALDDVKLGPGGIREIEFVVQALQIVRGGREPVLRVRNTRAALALLRERGHMGESAATSLDDAYVFLRDVEHRLQYRDDQQTQRLPLDDAERAWLAEAMGHGDSAGFDAALDTQRSAVTAQFDQVFGRPEDAQGEATDDALKHWRTLWERPEATDIHRERLAQAGFVDPDALVVTLAHVRGGARYASLPGLSRERFDLLVPQMLAVAAQSPGAAGAQPVFMRLLALLETVSRRSAYLALLIEHPPLLPRLATLMGASAWAADYLAQHPLLLDELLDPRVLLAEPDWSQWRVELARTLDDHTGDAERQMDALRHFRHAQTFRLLAQDIAGSLTIERLADHLSALADVILQATLDTCWRSVAGPDAPAPRFAIVGYGKLGGKELGYASDLDIVFLFDVDDAEPDADALPGRYTRLAQRIVTWLTSRTGAGELYDTDLRLRPDGASGLIVSSLTSFRKYQHASAWTWEHQALTRARHVAGDAAIGAAFEAEREAILRQPRDRAKLAHEVVEMRRRMHAGHPNPGATFDLKHDPGGMVDIEFAVQALVLAHASRHAGLTRNAGNIALLQMFADLGLAPPDLASGAAAAYREYRRRQHQVRLQGAPHARVDPAPYAAMRATVGALWVSVFGEPWKAGGAGG